ncbi:dodecin domain-containing protein [bacterium]|nr:dodecin domain-containing protein [bacterium]
MKVLKSEQILAESSKSFEDAVNGAVERFSHTVRGVRSANVNNMSAVVANGKVVSWRVNLQMTFEVEAPAKASAKASTKAAAASPARAMKPGRKR